MATYTYHCKQCDWVTDVKTPMGEAPVAIQCPTCFGEMRKVITAPAVIFKGTGWAAKTTATPREQKEVIEAAKAHDEDTKPGAKPIKEEYVKAHYDKPKSK